MHPDVLSYLDELAQSKATVDISQGVDARLITPELALALSKLRHEKQLHAAWDLMAYETQVLEGLKLLVAVMPHKVMAYVLIGFNTTPEEDLYRVTKLSEIGVDPFVMAFNKANPYQRRFARWVNHKAIYKSVKWEDYR